MTQAELAALLHFNLKSLHALEISEANKKIHLESLEKVADALGCELVYALVPRDSLQSHYRNRAREMATELIASVENTMNLEGQSVNFSEDYLEKLIDELIAGDFVHWSN